jgi:hypothetical protein
MLEKTSISDARVNQGEPGQPYAWIIMLKVAPVGGVDPVRNDGNRQASALAPLVGEDRRRSYYADLFDDDLDDVAAIWMRRSALPGTRGGPRRKREPRARPEKRADQRQSRWS